MCGKWSIYGLYDPRKPNEFRVIGKTKRSLDLRLRGYVTSSRRNLRLGRRLCPSQVWITGLLDVGMRPSIRLVEACDKRTWKLRETFLIAAYRIRGHRLLNVHKGGNGREDGSPKRICDNCGGRRKRRANGSYYCPPCYAAWRRTTARAYDLAYKREDRRAKKVGLTVKEFRARQSLRSP
jgi:hypothetical protein